MAQAVISTQWNSESRVQACNQDANLGIDRRPQFRISEASVSQNRKVITLCESPPRSSLGFLGFRARSVRAKYCDLRFLGYTNLLSVIVVVVAFGTELRVAPHKRVLPRCCAAQ